ncbi:DUF3592 domain-containing protein [Streptomyces olivochromogenes]|uniref:DUF3592 domain-containing protein n=1 Tax=Streptomyces olivochromogenes TaxID=1963 RepID=UPI0036D95BFF
MKPGKIVLNILLLAIWIAVAWVSFLPAWRMYALGRKGAKSDAECVGHARGQVGNVFAVYEYADVAGARHRLTVANGSSVRTGDRHDVVYNPRKPDVAFLWPVSMKSIRNHVLGGTVLTLMLALSSYSISGGVL